MVSLKVSSAGLNLTTKPVSAHGWTEHRMALHGSWYEMLYAAQPVDCRHGAQPADAGHGGAHAIGASELSLLWGKEMYPFDAAGFQLQSIHELLIAPHERQQQSNSGGVHACFAAAMANCTLASI